MSTQEITFPDPLTELREGKRLLDDFWMLTLFFTLFATGVPWFWRILNVDLAPIIWTIFGYAVVYLVATFLADRTNDSRMLKLLIGTTQLTGIAFIGLVWHLTGTLQNPMFLLIFLVPLVGSGLVQMGWKSHALALVAGFLVILIALHDTAELRWYLSRGPGATNWLFRGIPGAYSATARPFPEMNTPPPYLALVLVVFFAVLSATGLIAEALSSSLRRVHKRLTLAKATLGESETFAHDLLAASPGATALIFMDSLRIAQASQQFMADFGLSEEDLEQKDLFGAVEFSYPEVIQQVIAESGEIPLAVYRVGHQTRVASIKARAVSHNSVRYAYLSIDDVSQLLYQRAALDSIQTAVVVVSADRRIRYCSATARKILGDVPENADAITCLQQSEFPGNWWELGPKSRQECQVRFGGNAYRASCIASEISGEHDRLTVIGLAPVGGQR